ncbi:MAG: mechanosensitive ion channel family protein [Gammaproteobacteria bacterium]|nr:mechanosensitive ion channel family protein [Gammaproteobacteria bacterium]
MDSTLDRLQSYFASAGLEGWMTEVFIVILVTLTVNFIQKRVIGRVGEKLKETRNPWDDAFVSSMVKPLSALIWIVGLAFAIEVIQEAKPAAIFEAVDPIRDVGVIACLAWFLVRFIRQTEHNIVAAKEERGEEYDRTTLDAIGKLLRLSVIITAALVTLQTLGYSVSGVLAFGGIGGIAVGFAAKDMLANFFGGMVIYLDQPFKVGDWIRSPDRDIEGTVEKIGWRLTVIRTFDSRPLYVPNATFLSIAVQNPSRMRNRRIYETIGIRYDDAQSMRKIVEEVTDLLKSHPDIDTDRTLMVNFNAFAASSLDFFIYCMTKTTAWAEYHAVKQDVLLKILDIIESHGAEVAFPTRTLHVPDGIRTLEAEAA